MSEPEANNEAPRPSRIPVVGIGASAGGLEALTALIARLSADGMAFVVLQHLAPAHESMLAEILARDTSLRVVTVTDGLAVEKGTIYVAPPAVDVTLQGGALHLLQPAEVERAFGREGRPPMRFSARCIPAEQDRPALTLVVMKEGG